MMRVRARGSGKTLSFGFDYTRMSLVHRLPQVASIDCGGISQ